MSHQLTLQIADEAYQVLQEKAQDQGVSITEFLIDNINKQYNINPIENSVNGEVAKDIQDLLKYAGSISSEEMNSSDNEFIDADLLKVYANDF